MKRIIVIILSTIFTCLFSFSQEKTSPFGISLELSSKYMWRGIEYGDAPVVFPMLSYNYKGFNAFAMGAYAINGSHQEVDLGVNYSFKEICIGISDYYYPSSVGEKDSYLKWSSHVTGHSVEAYMTYTSQKLPLWFIISTYVYGADKKTNGSQAFSSYAEIGYAHKFNDAHTLSLALGANLNKGFYTDYEKGVNLVNITLKYETRFNFGKFNLPVSASYVLNPYKEKSFLTFSIYFAS